MNDLPKKLSPYFPWIGLLCLLLGVGSFYVSRQWDLLTNLSLALGAIFLLLYAIVNPDEVRELMSGKTAQYGTSAFLSSLFFAAIFVLLYFVAYQNPDWRYDATETKEFTPLDETVDLLEGLSEPIHVLGFFTPQTAFQQEEVQQRIEGLQLYTDNLTFEFIDPDANPLMAQNYDLTFGNTLVFTKGEGADQVFSKTTAPLNDRNLHTALVQLLNPVQKKAYFITGHGEKDIEDGGEFGLSNAVALLKEANFEVDTLPLFTVSEIPADATVLVMIDQQAPLTDAEFALLKEYLDNGGAAFIARDATLDNEFRAQLESGSDLLKDYIATDWGLSLRQDIVIDSTFTQAGESTLGLSFIGANYGASSVTANDVDRFGVVFNLARSIERNDELIDIAKVDLISTSDDAWGETDFEGLITSGFADPNPETDAVGRLTLAASGENRATGGRLILFGDTDVFSNAVIFQPGNNLVLTNGMNWLADDEVAVELTPRETVDRQLTIAQSQLNLVILTAFCLSPLIAIIAGVVVWYTRRQRR